MSISPLEIQKGSILCHEGKAKKVIAIGDYIQFEGLKAWIGGSMIEGEPISEAWMEKLGFVRDSTSAGWTSGKMTVYMANGQFEASFMPRVYHYVHELQLLHFAITREHLKVPKLK